MVLLAGGVVGAGVVGVRGLVSNFGGPRCQATAAGTSVDFDPSQTAYAATIEAVAEKRGLPARAATIAIATAIQESKLRNLKYGDRDSVGLFQQRPSQGWGTVEQILDPVYATNKFYDALVKVDGYEGMRITEIAQEVQKSAYPEAYADHEQEGRLLASTLSGHSPEGLGCRLDDADGRRPGRAKAALTTELGVTATVERPHPDRGRRLRARGLECRCVCRGEGLAARRHVGAGRLAGVDADAELLRLGVARRQAGRQARHRHGHLRRLTAQPLLPRRPARAPSQPSG